VGIAERVWIEVAECGEFQKQLVTGNPEPQAKPMMHKDFFSFSGFVVLVVWH
jgi:hypothetical protein